MDNWVGRIRRTTKRCLGHPSHQTNPAQPGTKPQTKPPSRGRPHGPLRRTPQSHPRPPPPPTRNRQKPPHTPHNPHQTPKTQLSPTPPTQAGATQAGGTTRRTPYRRGRKGGTACPAPPGCTTPTAPKGATERQPLGLRQWNIPNGDRLNHSANSKSIRQKSLLHRVAVETLRGSPLP